MSGYTPNRDPNFWKNDNEEIREVNCGSYALDVLDWYRPYDYDETWGDTIIESWNGYGTFEDALCDSTKQHIENILNDFDDIRVIKNFNEAAADERVILYREGVCNEGLYPRLSDPCEYGQFTTNAPWDWDYHFIWRDIEGIWHEKMGRGDVVETDEPNLEKPWIYDSLIYQGPVVLLAKKETGYAA